MLLRGLRRVSQNRTKCRRFETRPFSALHAMSLWWVGGGEKLLVFRTIFLSNEPSVCILEMLGQLLLKMSHLGHVVWVMLPMLYSDFSI